jgi:hypothetical protein
MTYSMNGTIGVAYHVNNEPLFSLYQSQKPSRKIEEPEQPAIFQKNWEVTNTSEPKSEITSVNQPVYTPPMPFSIFHEKPEAYPGPLRLEHLPESVKNPQTRSYLPSGYSVMPNKAEPQPEQRPVIPAEPEEVKSYSSLNADNPYVQKAQEAQLNEILSKVNHLGDTKTPEAKKPPQPKKPATPKAVSGSKAPVKAPENAPSVPAEPTKSPALQSPPPVSLIFSSSPDASPKAKWWSLAFQSAIGKETPEIKEWKRKNTEGAPKWLVEFMLGMQGSAIPASNVPGVALATYCTALLDLVDGAISLVEFTAKEAKHLVKNEPLQTTQTIALMSQFIEEEKARAVLNEDLETAKMARALVENFNQISPEKRAQGLLELSMVLKQLPQAVKGVTGTVDKLTSKGTQAVSKVEKALAPEPVQFATSAQNLPKESKQLEKLASELQELPKVNHQKSQVQETAPKSFTKTYDLRVRPSPLTSENLAQKSWFLGEVKPPYFSEKSTFTISGDKATTFMGDTYKSYKLNQDALLYRVGNSEMPLGEYYTFFKPKGTLGDQIDRGIPQVWPGKIDKNIVDTAYYVSIPKNTIIHVGPAAPQGGIYVGGKEQIYIEQAWKIPGIKVLEKYPLKEAYKWKQKVKK